MEKTNRVAIIGMGIINSQGIGIDEIRKNQSGFPGLQIEGESLHGKDFELSYSNVGDFDKAPFLPNISLRCIDKITIYTGVSCSMAAGNYISGNIIDPHKIGMVLGTALGSIVSISGFDLQSLKEGPVSVNPMEFPNTVSNAPTSKAGIWFGLKGPSITLSNGFTSSTDAVGFAFDEIFHGNASYYLAGGSEEISENVFKGYSSAVMSKAANQSNNTAIETIGEGSGMLFLTSMDEANYKEYKVLGEILDFYSYRIVISEHYIEAAINTIIAMLYNNNLQEEDVMLYTSHLPFNELSCSVCDEIRQCFGEERLVMHNHKGDTSINYLGLNGASNMVYALDDLKNSSEDIKGALVFDIGCDGKFSGVLIKK